MTLNILSPTFRWHILGSVLIYYYSLPPLTPMRKIKPLDVFVTNVSLLYCFANGLIGNFFPVVNAKIFIRKNICVCKCTCGFCLNVNKKTHSDWSFQEGGVGQAWNLFNQKHHGICFLFPHI